MDDGRWTTGDGRRTTGDGRWAMGDGRRGSGDGRAEYGLRKLGYGWGGSGEADGYDARAASGVRPVSVCTSRFDILLICSDTTPLSGVAIPTRGRCRAGSVESAR